MSTSHIPNLNGLRRGTGRGRGRVRTEQGHGSGAVAKDTIIQQTDVDAATSRLSAVEAGYLDDPFAKLLSHGGSAERRLPLMNRGTYVRTTAIDRLFDGFLSSDSAKPKQIISLGAGSDSRFFRLMKKYPGAGLSYHEFDFPTNSAEKIRLMQAPNFMKHVKEVCNTEWETIDTDRECSFHLRANDCNYYLHPLDLRSLSRPRRSLAQTEQEISQWGISCSAPTLVLSECCLVYLSPEEADAALSFFTVGFHHLKTPIGAIIYEPIEPHDAFGRTMISNLTARGIHLQTLNAHDTLEAQRERLRGQGFQRTASDDGVGGAEAVDVDFIWHAWTNETEAERIERLEWMDEVEEWRLLARHYCVAWGWKEAVEHGQQSVFSDWARLPIQDVKEPGS